MTTRVPCSACGACILPDTAAKKGGLCMPCKTGTRKSVEAAKLRREAEKVERESPARKHWEWLVRQVHQTPAGFAGLSPENQRYYAACLVEGEVYNGGFDQYFTNSASNHYDLAVAGLTAMGATESRRLLEEARAVFFGSSPVPASQEARRNCIRTSATPDDDRSARSDALDALFYEDRDDFNARATAYARRHGLHEDF